MADMTNYLALLRERGIHGWKALGRHLFAEIPADAGGAISGGQMRSYLQHSYGFAENRARELIGALKDIGVILPTDAEDPKTDRFTLHPGVQTDEG
jgi:hypothetical protein